MSLTRADTDTVRCSAPSYGFMRDAVEAAALLLSSIEDDIEESRLLIRSRNTMNDSARDLIDALRADNRLLQEEVNELQEQLQEMKAKKKQQVNVQMQNPDEDYDALSFFIEDSPQGSVLESKVDDVAAPVNAAIAIAEYEEQLLEMQAEMDRVIAQCGEVMEEKLQMERKLLQQQQINDELQQELLARNHADVHSEVDLLDLDATLLQSNPLLLRAVDEIRRLRGATALDQQQMEGSDMNKDNDLINHEANDEVYFHLQDQEQFNDVMHVEDLGLPPPATDVVQGTSDEDEDDNIYYASDLMPHAAADAETDLSMNENPISVANDDLITEDAVPILLNQEQKSSIKSSSAASQHRAAEEYRPVVLQEYYENYYVSHRLTQKEPPSGAVAVMSAHSPPTDRSGSTHQLQQKYNTIGNDNGIESMSAVELVDEALSNSRRNRGDNARSTPNPYEAAATIVDEMLGMSFDGVDIIELAASTSPRQQQHQQQQQLQQLSVNRELEEHVEADEDSIHVLEHLNSYGASHQLGIAFNANSNVYNSYDDDQGSTTRHYESTAGFHYTADEDYMESYDPSVQLDELKNYDFT